MRDGEGFEYVVVGAGAAGCVLAARLTAGGARVLLLEAGGADSDPRFQEMGKLAELWGSDADWKLATEPQAGLGGRGLVINQGKVLGGSTAINAMMYVRGNPRDYDRWSEEAGGGWSATEVLPHFKRSENYLGRPSPYHGQGGPVSVRDNPDPASRSPEFVDACVSLGYEGPGWDYNGERQENGAGELQFTITAAGKRSSAASAYLRPALDGPHLRLETEALATRVLFEGDRAVGVEYLQRGQVVQARAAREVIVSAGALLSPKLLMLSGIGAADELRRLGLPVVADLPGVGRNLQDHLQLPVVYRSARSQPLPELLTGSVLFVKTRSGPTALTPDLQLNYTPAVPRPLAGVLDFGGPAAIFLPILVQPASRGEVRLRSSDPDRPPLVDPHYLEDPADAEVFRQALRLIRELAHAAPLAGVLGEELAPGPGPAALEAHLRTQATTLWHPAGTCRMGRGKDAVVDGELKVRGVQGLRVADASIMPFVTSGNPAAACLMIGERLASLLAAPTRPTKGAQ
jgi:choline dehydrogenase